MEQRLGKGGFGQVYLGVKASSARGRNASAGPERIALKFEHKDSKGCSHGAPYEWTVYKYLENPPAYG